MWGAGEYDLKGAKEVAVLTAACAAGWSQWHEGEAGSLPGAAGQHE